MRLLSRNIMIAPIDRMTRLSSLLSTQARIPGRTGPKHYRPLPAVCYHPGFRRRTSVFLELSVARNPSESLLGNDFNALLSSWTPLAYSMNELNRSLGVGDAYPFELSGVMAGEPHFRPYGDTKPGITSRDPTVRIARREREMRDGVAAQ